MAPIDFTIDTQFALAITANNATMQAGSNPPVLSYDATAEVDVQVAALKTLFQYHTDSTDLTDDLPDDLLYKVVYTNISNTAASTFGSIDLNSNIFVTNNYIQTNRDEVSHDYIKYIASSTFGTHLGVDLFNNEVTFRSDLQLLFSASLNTKLLECATSDTNAGKEFVADATASASQVIMEQIFKSALGSTRFSSLESAGAGWYYMPFMSGDSVTFVLSIDANPVQKDRTGVGAIPVRKYAIKMNIIA
jgi:hypothetical protein